MNTTKKKTKPTSKSTGSRSTKLSPSSKTRSSKSPKTTSPRKNGSSPQAKVSKAKNSLSSTVTAKEAKSKTSASSRHDDLNQLNGGPFQGYDYDEMPELTKDQLALFKRVSPERHKELSAIDTVHIIKDGKVIEIRKLGRPKKKPEEKGNVVAIRLSKSFIKRLKERAALAGSVGWQTYAKNILEEYLDS
jgi:predicted DNA binding CopG/RHH family protein